MGILKTSHGGFFSNWYRKRCLKEVSFHFLIPTVIGVSLHARIPGGSWNRRFFVPAKLLQPNPLIRICSTGKRTNYCDRLPVVFKAAYGNEQQGSTFALLCININVCSSQLASGQTPGELLTPLVLNSILHKALQYSLHGDTRLASNFTFALRFLPETFHPHAPDSLNCLELRYKVRQHNGLCECAHFS